MAATDNTAALPWLGLGLSSNLNAGDEPHPWRLRAAEPGLFDFVEYSAPLSIDEARAHASLFDEMWEKRAEVPVLFHPVHLNLYGPALESVERLRALDAHARAVGSPWVGNDIGWWHTAGEPIPGYLYVAPPLNAAGLADAVAHAQHVQAHLSLPLLLENPAVIAVRGEMHVLDFMAEVHARTGCGLILDLGHLFSHQLARGLPLTAGFDGFPLAQVVEIHLAGGVVTSHGGRRVYVDDHTQPVREELFELFETVLPRCQGLRAVTFEGDGHPAPIAVMTLKRLRGMVPAQAPAWAEGTANAEGVAPSREPPASVQPDFFAASDPIRLFRETHDAVSAQEDAAGVAAELDFRLAVIAQTLDRRFPISRLLLAPTREDLHDFVRSAHYRDVFEQAQRTVAKAFQAWAIERVRERRDPALEAVLAVEIMTAHRPGMPAPGGVDLREALFAAGALRRHLLGRAWVGGEVALSGLEGLWQVVRRAVRGPR